MKKWDDDCRFFRLTRPKNAAKKIIDEAKRSKGIVVQDIKDIRSGKVRIDIFIECLCDDSKVFRTRLRMNIY